MIELRTQNQELKRKYDLLTDEQESLLTLLQDMESKMKEYKRLLLSYGHKLEKQELEDLDEESIELESNGVHENLATELKLDTLNIKENSPISNHIDNKYETNQLVLTNNSNNNTSYSSTESSNNSTNGILSYANDGLITTNDGQNNGYSSTNPSAYNVIQNNQRPPNHLTQHYFDGVLAPTDSVHASQIHNPLKNYFN
jgi:hypothetical protein